MDRKSRPHSFLGGVLVLVASAAVPTAAQDWTPWTKTQDLYLNTAADGANVTGRVTRFPLLIRLDASNFNFSEARADGKDLRFSKDAPGGRKALPFQMERWDAAASKAEFWVLMDTVLGSNATQSLRMHWGNPAAGDAPGTVFDTADGYLNVHHLGQGSGTRANAAAGFLPAAPQNYDGNEIREGMVGLCDSLTPETNSEDHLIMNDALDQVSRGFTFMAWVHPVDMGRDAALLSIGNGPGLDNIHIKRASTTTGLILDVYLNGNKSAPLSVSNVLLQNQWQHVAVTIDALAARVYRNGILVGSGTLTQPASPNRKAFNYIGKSSWYNDMGFAGRLDEVRLERVARGADWIKLSQANQAAAQTLVVYKPPTPSCAPAFAAPKDTALLEGSLLELTGRADCATGYTWTPVSGPVPRFLDPDVKTLQITLPRLTQDTQLVVRFSGTYADTVRSGEVRVTVKEGIPDPVYTLPGAIAWSGKDSLMLKPVVTNMEALKATRDSVLRFAWKTEGMDVDTGWRADGLMLKKSGGEGELKVSLCLDNGGTPLCKEVVVTVSPTTGIRRPLPGMAGSARKVHDAAGRRALTGVSGKSAPTRVYRVP